MDLATECGEAAVEEACELARPGTAAALSIAALAYSTEESSLEATTSREVAMGVNEDPFRVTRSCRVDDEEIRVERDLGVCLLFFLMLSEDSFNYAILLSGTFQRRVLQNCRVGMRLYSFSPCNVGMWSLFSPLDIPTHDASNYRRREV